MLIQIRKIIKLLRLAIASPRAMDPQNHYGELERLFTVTTSAFLPAAMFVRGPTEPGFKLTAPRPGVGV